MVLKWSQHSPSLYLPWGFIFLNKTHTAFIFWYTLNISKTGPLPNLHMSNPLPPIFQSYYLLIYVPPVLPWSQSFSPLELLSPNSSTAVLSHTFSDMVSSPSMVDLSFLLLTPFLTLGILKVPPLSPAQPLGHQQLYLPVRTNWGQGSFSAMQTDRLFRSFGDSG